MYQLFGFDEATQLAEETREPRRVGPQSLLRSIIAAGLLSFLISALVPMALPTVADEAGGRRRPAVRVIERRSRAGTRSARSSWPTSPPRSARPPPRTHCARACSSRWPAPPPRRSATSSRASRRPYACRRTPWADPGRVLDRDPADQPRQPRRCSNALIGAGVLLIYLAYLGVTLPALRARLRVPGTGSTFAGCWGLWWRSAPRCGARSARSTGTWPRAEFDGDEWYQEYSGDPGRRPALGDRRRALRAGIPQRAPGTRSRPPAAVVPRAGDDGLATEEPSRCSKTTGRAAGVCRGGRPPAPVDHARDLRARREAASRARARRAARRFARHAARGRPGPRGRRPRGRCAGVGGRHDAPTVRAPSPRSDVRRQLRGRLGTVLRHPGVPPGDRAAGRGTRGGAPRPR